MKPKLFHKPKMFIFDSMNVLLLVVLVVILFLITKVTVEKFTIAERHGILCNPIRKLSPLTPNSISLIMQGYNYDETPKIYRDGIKIIPFQFSRDSQAQIYYFTLAAPNGACNHNWMIETSDFVEPVVSNGENGNRAKVTLLRRRGGFNQWNINPSAFC
jgi:hypothetical protein